MNLIEIGFHRCSRTSCVKYVSKSVKSVNLVYSQVSAYIGKDFSALSVEKGDLKKLQVLLQCDEVGNIENGMKNDSECKLGAEVEGLRVYR